MSEDQPANKPEATGSSTGSGTPARTGRIVVGVDGSEGSMAALTWAVAEAKLRGAPIHAVLAWQPPQFYPSPNDWSPRRGPSGESAHQLADAALTQVSGYGKAAVAGKDVKISCEALEGDPAQVLVFSAVGAAMVVVGSHGHGGFVGALLGSVSQHVVAHAACPVIVVPVSAVLRARS